MAVTVSDVTILNLLVGGWSCSGAVVTVGNAAAVTGICTISSGRATVGRDGFMSVPTILGAVTG